MSLIKYASKVSALTLLSRFLGFFRDAIFARSFGAESGFDLFLLAFKIPNMMRRIFSEGAFSQAFIPVLAEYEKEDEKKKAAFLSAVYSGLLWVTVGLSFTVCVICEILLRFGGTWVTESHRLTLFIRLLQITFPYLVLITVTGFYTAALHARKQFSLAAFTPSFFNIILTTGAYLSSIYLDMPIYGTAATVMIGGILQVALMYRGYAKFYNTPAISIFQIDSGILKLFKLMCAGMYGASVAQIGMGIDSIILSMLSVGSVSWIYYAERLSYLPLGVFGVSIATVLSPSLAKSSQQQNPAAFQKQVSWGFVSAGIIGIPSAIGLFALAHPIVTTLFLRGKFTLHDVHQTASAVQVFALGIPAYMWIKVFAGAFYARQETWIPVQCATVALFVNVVIGCAGAYCLGHVGIACAVAGSAYANVVMLYLKLRAHKVYQLEKHDVARISKVSIASVFTLAGVWCIPALHLWVNMSVIHQLAYLSSAMVISLLGYATLLWMLALDWQSPAE